MRKRETKREETDLAQTLHRLEQETRKRQSLAFRRTTPRSQILSKLAREVLGHSFDFLDDLLELDEIRLVYCESLDEGKKRVGKLFDHRSGFSLVRERERDLLVDHNNVVEPVEEATEVRRRSYAPASRARSHRQRENLDHRSHRSDERSLRLAQLVDHLLTLHLSRSVLREQPFVLDQIESRFPRFRNDRRGSDAGEWECRATNDVDSRCFSDEELLRQPQAKEGGDPTTSERNFGWSLCRSG